MRSSRQWILYFRRENFWKLGKLSWVGRVLLVVGRWWVRSLTCKDLSFWGLRPQLTLSTRIDTVAPFFDKKKKKKSKKI